MRRLPSAPAAFRSVAVVVVALSLRRIQGASAFVVGSVNDVLV